MAAPRSADTIFQEYTELANRLAITSPHAPSIQLLKLFLDPTIVLLQKYWILFFYLRRKYDTQGQDFQVLQDAAVIGDQFVSMMDDLGPDGPSLRPGGIGPHEFAGALTLLSQVHENMFRLLNEEEALDEAIQLRKRSIEVRRQSGGAGDVVLPSDETSLSVYLANKFRRRKEYGTINEAIAWAKSALSRMERNNLQYTSALSNLASCYQTRYSQFETGGDTERAIELMQDAVAIAEANPSLSGQLGLLYNNLAGVIRMRFVQLSDGSEIVQECIGITKKSLDHTPLDSPDLAIRQLNMAMLYCQKMFFSRDLSDGDRALGIGAALLDDPGLNPQMKAKVKANLCVFWLLRYEQSAEPSDLEESIRSGKEVWDVEQDDGSLNGSLCLAYHKRYNLFRKDSDLQEFKSFFNVFKQKGGHTSTAQFQMLYYIAWVSWHEGRKEDALKALQECLRVYPQVRLLGRRYKEETFGADPRPKLGVFAAACAIACNRPCEAIEMLEQGRTVNWTKGLQERGTFTELKARYPQYEQRLSVLGTLLEQSELGVSVTVPDESMSPIQLELQPWEQTYTLTEQWYSLLRQIRSLEGFENFLLPPDFQNLRKVASKGPVVVINVSFTGCRALILAESCWDRPQIVPLHDDLFDLVFEWSKRTRENVEALASGQIELKQFDYILNDILNSLWALIIKPIRQALYALSPYARRIWWCPTDFLTSLPLHLVTNGFGKDRTPLEMVPSYTTTLQALLRAQSTESTRPGKMLAVSCAASGDFEEIPMTRDEVKALSQKLPPSRVTCLLDSEATKQDVISGLHEHDWVHLACHGVQRIDDPLHSHFLLHDGPLLMSEIIAEKIPNPEFAFLSSCHTASAIPLQADEAMHLAGSFQFLGFRAVVASMWAASDQVAAMVSQEVYGRIFKNGMNLDSEGGFPEVEQSAEALWMAIKTLRKKPTKVPLSFLAPFIHIGV